VHGNRMELKGAHTARIFYKGKKAVEFENISLLNLE